MLWLEVKFEFEAIEIFETFEVFMLEATATLLMLEFCFEEFWSLRDGEFCLNLFPKMTFVLLL